MDVRRGPVRWWTIVIDYLEIMLSYRRKRTGVQLTRICIVMFGYLFEIIALEARTSAGSSCPPRKAGAHLVIKIVLQTPKSFFVRTSPLAMPAHDPARKYYREHNDEPGDPSCLERPFDPAHAHDLHTAPPMFTVDALA
jgi:hypothetical protein